jgi:hypothetical protein
MTLYTMNYWKHRKVLTVNWKRQKQLWQLWTTVPVVLLIPVNATFCYGSHLPCIYTTKVFTPSWSQVTKKYRSLLPLLPANSGPILKVALSCLTSHLLSFHRFTLPGEWKITLNREGLSIKHQHLIKYKYTTKCNGVLNTISASYPVSFPNSCQHDYQDSSSKRPLFSQLNVHKYLAIVQAVLHNICNWKNSEVNKVLTARMFSFYFILSTFIGWPRIDLGCYKTWANNFIFMKIMNEYIIYITFLIMKNLNMSQTIWLCDSLIWQCLNHSLSSLYDKHTTKCYFCS